jgi:hypothetical protein
MQVDTSKLCVDLNLDLEPFTSLDFLKKIPDNTYAYPLPISEFVSPQLISLFKNAQLDLYHSATVFVCKPNKNTRIHTDVLSFSNESDVPDDFIRINYVLSGNDSYMNWYDVDNQNIGNIGYNNKDIPLLQWEYDQVRLIHKQRVGFPSIVQVGIPHNISNNDNTRICISLRPLKNGCRLTMAEACFALGRYIIN